MVDKLFTYEIYLEDLKRNNLILEASTVSFALDILKEATDYNEEINRECIIALDEIVEWVKKERDKELPTSRGYNMRAFQLKPLEYILAKSKAVVAYKNH
jgi:hydrogenase maturation factor HypF (carbamoyltransferase family)